MKHEACSSERLIQPREYTVKKLSRFPLIGIAISLFMQNPGAMAQQGDARQGTCFDDGTPKRCYVRQSESRLYGNNGWHVIAHWSDGDTTEIFIPSKNASDRTFYYKFNKSDWSPGDLNFCASNGFPPYIRVDGKDGGGTGCIPDFLPNY